MSRRETVEAYFEEGNKQGDDRIVLSPSGRYRLVISSYKTKEGGWNYTRGRVYRVQDDHLICDIKRNYSGFHHSFVTKNGEEWLITGRSYMSQTIVNLETGAEYEPSGEQYNGFAFCWAKAVLSPDGNTLLVDGCYWAAPYEYKFFDFTNPAKGWPELELDSKDGYLPADEKAPEFCEDGTIICYQSREFCLPLQKYETDLTVEELETLPEENGDKEGMWEHTVTIKTTVRREGDEMKVIDKWISPDEQQRIKRSQEAKVKFEKWLSTFKNSDPLYLRYQELLKSSKLSTDKYESYGKTYSGWCPDFTGTETRWCRRLLERNDKTPYTVDLEWAVETGPIKLVIFKNGKSHENKFFEHSVEGMNNAFSYTENLASSYIS